MTPANPLRLDLRAARRLVLEAQGLRPPRSIGRAGGVVGVAERLGSVQFDPIDVVGWSTDLVMQSRVRGYRREHLGRALYKDRSLVHGRDKMACVMPVSDWPLFRRHRNGAAAHYRRRYGELLDGAGRVLDIVRSSGPVSSLEVSREVGGRVISGWGTGARAGRVLLDYLHDTGELAVADRVGTRKVYDLSKRLLGELAAKPDPFATEEEYLAWRLWRRVRSLGLADPRDGQGWLGIPVDAACRRDLLRGLVEAGELAPVRVDGTGREWLAEAAAAERPGSPSGGRPPAPRAALLAPLDNLLWSRGSAQRLFGLDYRWEVYVPASKRRYGYYVLPVLYGDRFVARAEPVLRGDPPLLELKGWWWEKGAGVSRRMREECLRGLGALAASLSVPLGDCPGLTRP